MNEQADSLLPVMEEFLTLQGEGYHTGSTAYFIRIGGCNVGCHWCDVKSSWDASLYPLKNIKEITHKLIDLQKGTFVVITGGEPLMFDLNELTKAIQKIGLKTHLETSGTQKLSGNFDWIALSPKKISPPQQQIYKSAHELKVVIYNKHDLKFAEQEASKVSDQCKLYLQPEWSKLNRIREDLIAYIKAYPKWTLSLQIHKFLEIP